MDLLCERCYAPVDPDSDRFYRLAHLYGADHDGTVHWRNAVVHTVPCAAAGSAHDPHDRAA
ncbi:hypothetical protein WIS52_02580 [Pseudonocardia nematodicida]|uniref:C2H2-type domain-containing protein n=1 Tax=Pseudonocardia nematodicida TaxID=1206997 RepID=A0ABV1K4H8_9PSEU